ncbi:MAG: hypothetical protein EP319_00295 [Deltaproteobacteria bacterium]|nr:MAG: hypothetical protein EP319_00295 [Deltaproteobacteria bacterium]
MKNLNVFILVLLGLVFISCEDGTGQNGYIYPNNEYQTTDQLQYGAKTNECYRARYALENNPEANVEQLICERDENGNITKKRKVTYITRDESTLRTITNFATSFLNKDKETREKEGGEGCKCEPMGESCAPKSCTCSEICPATAEILKSRQSYIRPTAENSMFYNNSSSHNDTAYETYPLSGGYCSGHVRQRQKFTYLADFQPDLRSTPKMKVGDETWKKYTKAEIDGVVQQRKTVFHGFKDFTDLKEKDPELGDYLKSQLGVEKLEDIEKNPHMSGYRYKKKGDTYWSLLNDIEFKNPDKEKIPADTAYEPYSGKRIPPMHEEAEYREFMERQVQLVSRYSQPAVIPGFSNLLELSADPQYDEIIGSNAAIDWKHYAELDDDMARKGTRIVEDKGHDKPMTKKQIEDMMKTVKERMPEFDPSKSKEEWNKGGPWETMPLSFRAKNKDATAGTQHLYHAVEVWAWKKLPDGKEWICIADPNSPPGGNDDCNVRFVIDPNNEAEPITYSEWPNRTIGKMMLEPSAEGQNGRYMIQLAHACRHKNKNNFYMGCDAKGKDDVNCGDKDYESIDVDELERDANERIERQRRKLEEAPGEES